MRWLERRRRLEEQVEWYRQDRNAMADESSTAHMTISLIWSQLQIVAAEMSRLYHYMRGYDHALREARDRQVDR